MLRWICAGLLLLTVLFFSGCKEILPVSITKIEGSKILSLDTKGIKAEVYIRIKNPNSTGFNIYKSALDAELNGIPVGKAHLKKKIRIKKNSEDVHVFEVESDFTGINLTDIPKLLMLVKAKSLKVHLKGNIKVGKIFYKKEFPVELTETVKL
jgi:LEA14-like dessication related protein